MFAHRRTKLSRKGLDMIVLNDVSDRRIGFDSNDNAVTVITIDCEERIDFGSKAEISRAVIERIARKLGQPAPAQIAVASNQPGESDSASG